MSNPFKRFFTRTKTKQAVAASGASVGSNTDPLRPMDDDELLKIAIIFETLDKFRKADLLHIDFNRHIVTISSILSQHYLYDQEVWQRFLHQLHLWAVYEFSVVAYRHAYTKVLADAEAAAFRKQGTPLDYDAKRIARMEAAEGFDAQKEVEKCPDIQFVVIGATRDNQPLLVARYIDGEYRTLSVPEQ